MGTQGLRKATQVAILNANYLEAKLKDKYKVLYRGKKGRVAHEFILDIRPIKVKLCFTKKKEKKNRKKLESVKRILLKDLWISDSMLQQCHSQFQEP